MRHTKIPTRRQRRAFLRAASRAGIGALSIADAVVQLQAQAADLSSQGVASGTPTISTVLSEYASRLRFEDLAPEVVRYAKHLLLDTLGVAIGAYDGEPPRIVRAVVDDLGGRPESTVIGSGARTSASLAALANGAMVRYLDFMDIYFNVDNPHPTENIPVALAVAEREHRSGKDLLVAIVVGFELQGRFADTWSAPAFGFHNVTMGGYVTPVVAGKLLGLTDTQMVNAIGLAGATSHTTNYLGDQVTMIKALGYGLTGQRGVEAALMAQRGMTGPADVIETFMRLVRFTGDASPLLQGGPTPRILHTAIKPYAAEYMTHAPVEALLRIQREHPVPPGEIASIELRTFHTAIDVLGKPGAYRPQTRETADHSLPYCLAIAWLDGALGPAQFTRQQWTDSRVIELMAKVVLHDDPAFTALYPAARPAEVEVHTRGGLVFRNRVDYPKGDPRNPMSYDEVVAKFRSVAGRLMSEQQMQAIVEAVDAVERVDDVAQLTRLLVL